MDQTKQRGFNANQFPDLYKRLGIKIPSLGCVMLDVDPKALAADPYRERLEASGDLYYAKDPAHFWIDGYVAGKTPHITLLYGLLKPAYEQKADIEEVLKGWSIDTATVESIGFFPSPMQDEPYFCIVAHIKISPELLEGHERLELLPHINTFPGYKAHLTLAYVHADEEVRDSAITNFEGWLVGRELKIRKDLNFGSDK